MLSYGKERTALMLIILMISSSVLAGCTTIVTEPGTNKAPKESMGLWWPTVDGIIDDGPILMPDTEWSDSAKLDINFVDDSNGKHPAELRYKSVNYGMALAIEIDGVEETPQQILVTFPDSSLVLESKITTVDDLPDWTEEGGGYLAGSENSEELKGSMYQQMLPENLPVDLSNPTLSPISFFNLNQIATVHDLDDDLLTMEALASMLLDHTTEVEYSISIVFSDSTWTFSKTTNFYWVLPYLIPRSDIGLSGIEVIQAVQTEDMQIPLVKGKKSLARVYVDSGDFPTANVEVVLIRCFDYWWSAFPSCNSAMTKQHVAVQNPDRTNFSHSANFPLPESWVSFGDELHLTAIINPSYPNGVMDYVDPDTSNNYLAESFDLHTTHNLGVWVFPTAEDIDGDGSLDTRAQPTMEYWMDSTEAVFPVSDIDDYYISTTISPDFTGWTNNKIRDWMRTLDEAVTPICPKCDYDQLFAARPSGVGGLSDPLWSSSGTGTSRVSVCGGSATSRQLCAAHEITHNLGPRDYDGDGDGFSGSDSNDEDWGTHLQCVANSPAQIGLDDVWKALYGSADVNANILDLGWDSNVPNPDTNVSALIPSQYPDFMSYCMAGTEADTGDPWNLPSVTNQTKWISTYRYLYLFDQLSDWDGSSPPYSAYYGDSSDTADSRQSQTTRVVRGMASEDGSNPVLLNSWTFDGPLSAAASNAHGDHLAAWDYAILAKDSTGNIVDTIHYSPNFDAHESDELEDDYFSFFIQDNDLIHSIELLDKSGSVIDSLQSSGVPITHMLPLGTTEYTRDSPANVSWTQASPTSNRETLYQLEYLWGDGMWLPIGGFTNSTSKVIDFGTLPAGNDSKFRVRATNGFDTYYSESTEFSLPNQEPVLKLETSGALGINTVRDDPQTANLQVTQGDSFSITPTIIDADWTPVNYDSFTVALKRDGETIWGDPHVDESDVRASNRVVSWPTWEPDRLISGPTSTFTFPNGDLLPGEMTPGSYEFEMTYVDEGGASVTQIVSFDIVDPIYTYGNVLDEYRSNLESTDTRDVELSKDELLYYVELERAARGDDYALTDSGLAELQALFDISDSRADELQASICVPPDCEL